MLIVLSFADEQHYPNRLPGFSEQRTSMLCEEDSDNDDSVGSLLIQDSDSGLDLTHSHSSYLTLFSDDDSFRNRLQCLSSVGAVVTAVPDDDADYFPNLLSTLPDPSTLNTDIGLQSFSVSADTFPNHKCKLHFCLDCGSTAGPRSCKCEKT